MFAIDGDTLRLETELELVRQCLFSPSCFSPRSPVFRASNATKVCGCRKQLQSNYRDGSSGAVSN
jgi:hypothetical protein